MARQVLDIFVSSTSEDMRDYRNTVTDVLSGLGQFVVRMESFGAKPSKPLATCREEVERCDALIVVVSHRYGWIPPAADGGDDERSITWWEVKWALDAGKPVYAFLIDPKAPWSGPREQDRLLSATSQKESLTIWRAVRGLQSFRSFLENETTRALFGGVDHLGRLVATSLFPWLLEHAGPVRSSSPADLAPQPIVPPDAPQAPVRALSGQVPSRIYWQEQVHLLSARAAIAKPSPVRVAIVAGRPRITHPALAGVSITSVSVEADAPADVADDYTTGLAALIASSGSDGFDGVAPGAELLAISALGKNLTANFAAIASSIDRAVLGGARVLCLTVGSTEPSAILEEAINEAIDAGVTVLAAAGNLGSDQPHYPAALESVIAVGAVDYNSEPTPWTSYGSWVELMAPGDDVQLPVGESGYSFSKGTTWSCAIASGIVALLLEINPKLTPSEIRQLLLNTAGPLKGGDQSKGKLINAGAAARSLLQTGAATR